MPPLVGGGIRSGSCGTGTTDPCCAPCVSIFTDNCLALEFEFELQLARLLPFVFAAVPEQKSLPGRGGDIFKGRLYSELVGEVNAVGGDGGDEVELVGEVAAERIIFSGPLLSKERN